jgi:acylaminoacyl-peptidase
MFIDFLFSNVRYFFPPSQHSQQELLAIIFAIQTFAAGIGSQAMFSISQANLLANKRKKFIVSAHISQETKSTTSFQWAPFPVEMTGVSTIVPSPSGSKLLVVRNPENESASKFEIWGSSQLEKEFHIPQSVHGSVYIDGW